jgi:hypothetical protein
MALVLGAALPAGASQMFTSGTAIIGGTVNGFGPSAGPWTAELFASPGQCLRLLVTSGGDLIMNVVAPNGQNFFDDDSGGSLHPLVKINNTPNNGWYTVSISHFNGAATQENFTLQYQRLAVNSSSCLPATAPRVAATAAKSAGTTAARAPADGEPGH